MNGQDLPPLPCDRLLDEGLEPVVDAAAAEGICISAKTALRWCVAGLRGCAA